MDRLKKCFYFLCNKYLLIIKSMFFKDGTKFSWSDNSQLYYTNWASGFNPSEVQQNTCVFLENKSNQWNSTSCSAENDFICKITKGKK